MKMIFVNFFPIVSQNLNLESIFVIENSIKISNKGCVTLCGLAIYNKKSILRQKKDYENSNISPCKNIIFIKNPQKETKIVQDIVTL